MSKIMVVLRDKLLGVLFNISIMSTTVQVFMSGINHKG